MHLHYVFSIYDAMKQNIYTISSIVKLALLVTFVLVAVIFTGCTKGPEVEAEEPYLNIRSELYPFDASGGKDLLVFSTNTPWEAKIETPETAAPADAWCGVTPSSGEAGENLRLQVTVGENDTYSERGVFLVLRAGTREERIAVRQRQKNAILSGQNDYAVSCEEQTLTVEVQANVAYETVVESGQQWIKRGGSAGRYESARNDGTRLPHCRQCRGAGTQGRGAVPQHGDEALRYADRHTGSVGGSRAGADRAHGAVRIHGRRRMDAQRQLVQRQASERVVWGGNR